MKTLSMFMAFLIIASQKVNAQVSSKQFEISELGWSVSISDNSKIVDSIAPDESRVFHASNNVFSLSITHDTLKNIHKLDSAWKSDRIKFYESFSNPKVGEVGKYLANYEIDNVDFKKFVVEKSLNGHVVFTANLIYTLYKGYHIRITYVTTSKTMKQEFEDLLQSSKFESIK